MLNQKPQLGELPDASQFSMRIALWLFNEGAGNLVNDTAGGYDATLSSALSWVPGKFGYALNFDNSVYGTLGPALTLPNRNLSVVTWVKNVQSLKGSILGESGASPYEKFCYTIKETTTGSLYIGDGTNYDNIQATAVSDWTIWHQYAVTVDSAGNVQHYLDGKPNGSGVCVKSSTTFTVEISPDGYRPIDADVDHIGIFECLTASQIAFLYRNPFPWFEKDEVSHLYVPPTGISMPLVMQQMNQFNGGAAA